MPQVEVDASELADMEALERRLDAKVLSARVVGETAVVEVLPVAALGWYVMVRDCRADLVLVRDGKPVLAEVLDLDPQALEALVEVVVYGDNAGAINMSGIYYPTSQASVTAFERLVGRGRPGAQSAR